MLGFRASSSDGAATPSDPVAELIATSDARGQPTAPGFVTDWSTPPQDELHGLWATGGPDPLRLLGAGRDAEWRLSGSKHWCSGATLASRVLVTARLPNGLGALVIVDLAARRRRARCAQLELAGNACGRHPNRALHTSRPVGTGRSSGTRRPSTVVLRLRCADSASGGSAAEPDRSAARQIVGAGKALPTRTAHDSKAAASFPGGAFIGLPSRMATCCVRSSGRSRHFGPIVKSATLRVDA